MPRVISFHYTLKSPKGEILDSSEGQEPLTYLEGARQIIPGLESKLASLSSGSKSTVVIPTKEAYGEHDERFVIKIPKSELPPDVKVGDEFQDGRDEHSHPMAVTAIDAEHVTLDANHPLAGMDLTFDVQISEVREATAEEVQHGHAHGAGGHHHH